MKTLQVRSIISNSSGNYPTSSFCFELYFPIKIFEITPFKTKTKPPMDKNAQNTAQLLKRNREFGVSRTKGGADNFSLGVISLISSQVISKILKSSMR